MPGRPIRVVATSVVSALVAALSASAAFAGCYTCGCSPTYYVAPAVVTSPCGGCATTYVAPRVVYASPCATAYAPQPAYRVDLGPTITTRVLSVVEPVADYYPRRAPYVGRHDRAYWSYYASRRYAAVEEEPEYRVSPSYRLHPRIYGPRFRRDLRVHRDLGPVTRRLIGPRFVHAPHRGPMITRPHHPAPHRLVP